MTPDLPYPPNHPKGQHAYQDPYTGGTPDQPLHEWAGKEDEPVPSPEEMAEQFGVAVEDLGEALMAKLEEAKQAMAELERRMNPPKPNREQRRAMRNGKPRIGNGAVVNRKRR